MGGCRPLTRVSTGMFTNFGDFKTYAHTFFQEIMITSLSETNKFASFELFYLLAIFGRNLLLRYKFFNISRLLIIVGENNIEIGLIKAN